jgi:hypothetical protein
MANRPVVIDLGAKNVIVEYTAGDDLVISATVLDTDGTDLIWGGSSTATAQIRVEPTDASPVDTFVTDISTNGKLVLTLSAAKTWALWTSGVIQHHYSVQVIRSGRAFTYLSGTLQPTIRATHP